MVVIRINAHIKDEQADFFTRAIHNQAKDGVIVLPNFCELLNEVPADEEIQVIRQDERVAELEKELAAAMDYISVLENRNKNLQQSQQLSVETLNYQREYGQ